MSRTRNKNNPFFYEKIQCETCGSTVDLCAHKYNDDILCGTCVDKINEEFNQAKTEAEENPIKEDYYTDYSYNHLLQERNA